MIVVSLDPGVNTGFAVYDRSKKEWLRTGELFIDQVFEMLSAMILTDEDRIDLKVFIEDPRMISGTPEKALGAGWVRVLAGQYENFCIRKGIKYSLIRPDKAYLKKDVAFVKTQTGIETKESKHNERDAIMILFFYGLY